MKIGVTFWVFTFLPLCVKENSKRSLRLAFCLGHSSAPKGADKNGLYRGSRGFTPWLSKKMSDFGKVSKSGSNRVNRGWSQFFELLLAQASRAVTGTIQVTTCVVATGTTTIRRIGTTTSASAPAVLARQESRFFYGRNGSLAQVQMPFLPVEYNCTANKFHFSLLWYCNGKAERDFISGQQMAYEIINIPLSSSSKTFNTDDLNKFCANKKIIERKIVFFQEDGTAYWSAGGRKPPKKKAFRLLLLPKTLIL